MSNSRIVFGMFDDKISLDEDMFSIENAKKLANKIDFVQKNAETYINEYFQDVIIDVDLRREILKAEIDKYSDELIESLKKKQKDSIDISKESNELKEKIDNSKIELDELIEQICDINIKMKVKNIDEKFSNLKVEFENNLAKYKSLLTENKLSLSLYEIPIQKVFGELKVIFIRL